MPGQEKGGGGGAPMGPWSDGTIWAQHGPNLDPTICLTRIERMWSHIGSFGYKFGHDSCVGKYLATSSSIPQQRHCTKELHIWLLTSPDFASHVLLSGTLALI